MLFFNSIAISAETTDNVGSKEIDIATSPHKVFFNLNNLKPGDKTSKVLTVKNNGKQDFNYLLSNKFLNGSEIFYNELLLEINDGTKNLFTGKLKDFEKLDSRHIKSGESDKLNFKVEIPYELGNEFQGLGSEFEFKLYVEGTLGGVIPVDNKLPTTGSEMFNLFATGTAILLAGLLLFAYIKRKKLDTKRP